MNAISPEGNPIIGTMEVVEGVARAEITIGDNGELNVEYSGETEVDWNSQRTKVEEGERLFVCSQRKLWRESQVVLATQASTVEQIRLRSEGFFSNPFFGRQRFGQPPWL